MVCFYAELANRFVAKIVSFVLHRAQFPLQNSAHDKHFVRAKEMALAQERGMNITKNIGMLLLAIYLILAGIALLVHTIVIPAVVMGILALVAGILILIGK